MSVLAGGASSVVIVPIAVASLIVAPLVAPERVTVNSSLSSGVTSPLIVIWTVAVFCPTAKLTVPLAAT